jgi:hypothetical protein
VDKLGKINYLTILTAIFKLDEKINKNKHIIVLSAFLEID